MKKIKPIKWVIIILCATLIPLATILIITRAILNPPATWWWTFGTLIFEVVSGLIIGIIILIIRSRKKKTEEKTEIDPDDAEKRAKILLQEDDDNPDNFIRKDIVIKKVGRPGGTRTPVLWLMGKGSETNDKIDIIVNLNNPKKEIEFLHNKSDDFVKEAIRTIAEDPAEIEETILGTDAFGNPQTKIRKVSVEEKKKEEEKKEGEVQNKF